MALKLFNTLSRQTETLEPRAPGKIGLYTCGPTVYHYAHIGNLRTYLFEDLLTRTLRKAGFELTHVCNITDVGHLTSDADEGEDKMEKGAAREGKSVWQIAEFYSLAFFEDLKKLNIVPATHWPKATDHIPEQIAMIRTLMDKGFGYKADDGIYFDVSKFPNYGHLARKDMKGQEAGARVAVDACKRNPEDFALWKFSPAGQKRLMEWESPWGKGFPGWHIECSAMSQKYLGDQFDIHCGGIDHIPVHHSNEIAQSEAALGVSPWVKVWMHGEFLIMDKAKMSKSSGEFLTLKAVCDKGYEPLDYRYLNLGAHYRQGLSFAFESMDQAKAGRANLMAKCADLVGVAGIAPEEARKLPAWAKFWEALEEDLNGPRALAALFDMLKDASLNPAQKAGLVREMDDCLGLKLLEPREIKVVSLASEEKALLDARAAARAAKDFKKSDELRDALKKLGIAVHDGKEGQSWTRQ